MRRTVTILSIVLVGQLVLAAGLNVASRDQGAEASHQALAAFQPDKVDAIRIADGSGDPVLLERRENGWRLAGADGFPADAAAIERLLSKLDGFADRLPVARSDSARERFRVADDQFKRRVTLMAGGEPTAKIFLGKSAGPGQVYARAAGGDLIQEVAFTLRHASADVSQWQDESVAAVQPDNIRKAKLPGFTLQRADGGKGWRLVRGDTASPEKIKPAEANRVLRRLARPDFQAVSKGEPPPGKPDLTYTLVTENGDEIRFAYVAGTETGKQARFYRNDQPWIYSAPAKQLSKVKKLKPEELMASAPAAGEAASPTTDKPKRRTVESSS